MGSPTARLRLFEVTSKRATSVSSLRRHPPEVNPGTRSGFGFWYGLERMECVCYQTYEGRRRDETYHLVVCSPSALVINHMLSTLRSCSRCRSAQNLSGVAGCVSPKRTSTLTNTHSTGLSEGCLAKLPISPVNLNRDVLAWPLL